MSPSKTTSALPKAITHKAINYVKLEHGKWYWYIIIGIIIALAILRGMRALRHRHRRKIGVRAKEEEKTNVKTTEGIEGNSREVLGTGGTVGRVARATEVAMTNLLHVRAFPLWVQSSTTVAEIFWTIAYIGISLALCFYKTKQSGLWRIQNTTGTMSLLQIPLVIGLSTRDNVLSYLTGISYQKLNFLHRAAARTMILCIYIHLISYCRFGLGNHGPGTMAFSMGLLAFISVNILFVSSLRVVRRYFYELFLVLHIVFVLIFIVAAYLHRPKSKAWIWPGFILWGLDRFVTIARKIGINKLWLLLTRRKEEAGECLVEPVGENVIRLTVTRKLQRWGPGQHALITMPAVAALRYEEHPLSYANISTPDKKGRSVFIIRAYDGFTRRLIERLDTDMINTLPCYLDGPYGTALAFDHHDVVLLIAAGTGVTHVSSVFLSIIASHRKGTAATRHLHLIWNIRNPRDLSWISPLLNEALSEPIEGLEILIDLHVSKRSMAYPFEDARSIQQIVDEEQSDKTQISNTPETSGATSIVSDIEEKTELKKGIDDDNTVVNPPPTKQPLGLPDLNENVTKMIRIHCGRPDLLEIMRNDIAMSNLSMGVSVCGPLSIALDVRRTVIQINTAKNVMAGQANIDLQVEYHG